MLQLKAPAGISNVYTIRGRALMVAADGTIEVTWEEAAPLCAAGFATS